MVKKPLIIRIIQIPGYQNIFFIYIICFLFLNSLTAQSWYLQENFNFADGTSNIPGWDTYFRYGRDGLLLNPRTSQIIVTNNELAVTRKALYGNASYNTFWCGTCIRHDGTSFTASPEKPFGFQVLRTYANLDPRQDTAGEDNYWQFAGAGIWIVEDNGSVNNEWDFFPAFVYFYEVIMNGGAEVPRSKWGVFSGSPVNFDLGSAIRPGGALINLTNTAPFSLEWHYNNDHGGISNTNTLGLKMTHNGSIINFFINPDPLDANSYPNEYCLVGTLSVLFKTNLKIMLGHEANMNYTQTQDAFFDTLLVRSVSQSTGYKIEPAPERKDVFICTVDSVFSSQDSGISEIFLDFPGNIAVQNILTEWGDKKNNGVISPLVLSSLSPASGTAFIQKTGSGLSISFYKKNNQEHNVINYHTVNPQIQIEIRLEGPLQNIELYVSCEKYNSDNYSFTATTGRQKALSSGMPNTGLITHNKAFK